MARWDIRFALDTSLVPKQPDPFESLPICPPAMLVGPDGLPARPNHIASEGWLRARPAANAMPPEGLVRETTISDSEYPIHLNWDGILVDDPGFNGTAPNKDDVVRRLREVLGFLWNDKAHDIEQQACDILEVNELRDYFRKPGGFFSDHLKRYSKSRRKAPIYWPLSTDSGRYTLWIYYQRLTDQTLFICVNDYLDPKIAEIERDLDRLNRSEQINSRAREQRDDLLDLQTELKSMRSQLLDIARLPYKPNLNDGVLINAAPLRPLFRYKPWQVELKKCWEDLKRGEYDWSHMAYNIWPDRIRQVCRKDKSIAIAHGLEDLYEEKEIKKVRKRGK
jgi:hypothetical protein